MVENDRAAEKNHFVTRESLPATSENQIAMTESRTAMTESHVVT